MQILILDDDKSYGALLASASKKLGHRGIVTLDTASACASLSKPGFDAVLVDLEMPAGSGLDFLHELRTLGHRIPVAFFTGTCQDHTLIDEAAAVGKVLPKVWTHTDLRSVLTALQLEANALRRIQQAEAASADQTEPSLTNPAPLIARDSGPDMSELTEPLATAPPPFAQGTGAEIGDGQSATRSTEKTERSVLDARELGETRRNTPRVRITCADWDTVRRLCGDIMRGLTTITVRAQVELRPGDDAVVALGLPDEMVVSIGARVLACREPGEDGKRPYQLDLIGLGDDEITYLLDCCEASEPPVTEPAANFAADASPDIATSAALTERTSAPFEPGVQAVPDASDTVRSLPAAVDSGDLDLSVFDGDPKISWD